ncbi:MAG: enoyl-CoA hydratase/isomerase family protein [Gammaproteobacteria bacterium]|nr:enoyl-CoA hydratase/isomerase family protein [Gammaproteobacteria bacterium]
MYTIPEINFEEISGRDGNLGLITLTRTQALNALNHPMLSALAQQLTEWEAANHIKAVVIRAAPGRAFSAGGDLRGAYEHKKAADPLLPVFFRDEYRINRHIHQYKKPYIALLDGIVMGGGVGISIHASHRVATDRLDFAMPETGIGFFPDVGSTWYLSRLPHAIGFYLALSGARISLNDCMAAGLIDFPVKTDQFPEIIYALADASIVEGEARQAVTEALQPFTKEYGSSELWLHREEIQRCFSENTIEDILEALDNSPETWMQNIAPVLRTKSPTSLKVTLRALQEAATLDFDAAIEMEYRLCCHFLEGHDFFEGIRALIIDKDRKPHWKPATLKAVTSREVKKYFQELKEDMPVF